MKFFCTFRNDPNIHGSSRRFSTADLREKTKQSIVRHITKGNPHHPLRDTGILQQTPNTKRAVKIGQPQGEASQAGIAAWVKVFHWDEDQDIADNQYKQIDPWVKPKQHQVDHQEIPYGGEPFEEKRLFIGLGIDLGKLISRAQKDRKSASHLKTDGQEIRRFDQNESRDHHIIKIIDDVIEQGPIHAPGIFLY